jgi:hypothetical protein
VGSLLEHVPLPHAQLKDEQQAARCSSR